MSSISQKENLDNHLSSIAESIDSTASVVDKLENIFDPNNSEITSDLIKSLLETVGSEGSNALDSISLLSLKNTALLGYVTDLALLLAIKLKDMREEESSYSTEKEEVLKSTVTNRVILEKGIKSLEKRISYQLEKMVNAYHRREKEQKDVEDKVNKIENEPGSSSDEKSENDDDDDDEEEEDEEEGLNFKPNPAALLKRTGKAKPKAKKEYETEDIDEDKDSKAASKEKYRPPKIAAMSIADPDKEVKGRKKRNLQSMDEYLQDISEAPTMEKSIGSTIINNGRDVKSKKQLEKEAEIQRYEEENFTRLPTAKTKESKESRAKRMRNEFMGEDWSMFDSKADINPNGGAKKRKRLSAWERAKRKID